MKTDKTLAIIPARGGSKRIPKKNIKSFLGKPIIQMTIEKLIQSNIFDAVLVSTDDSVIAKMSKESGAMVPFIREERLADDFTPTAPVVADALGRLKDGGFHFDFCCCVYPCVPLLTSEDLAAALSKLKKTAANFCYSVTKFSHPIQRSLATDGDGFLMFREPECELTRTQDLDIYYHDAGQFYWGTVAAWLSGAKMHSEKSIGFELPSWRAIDIDDRDDWYRAEMLCRAMTSERA